MATILTALVTVANTAALAALVYALFKGRAGSGPTLFIDTLHIWGANVIIFALWFWRLDRGGAALRSRPSARDPDFLFPQRTPAEAKARFVPGFVDDLFLAPANATAFSPTDPQLLRARPKVLMMAETLGFLLTVALVAARAVTMPARPASARRPFIPTRRFA